MIDRTSSKEASNGYNKYWRASVGRLRIICFCFYETPLPIGSQETNEIETRTKIPML